MKSAGKAGFDKSLRLLKARQYRKVLREGKKYRNTMFLLVGIASGYTTPRLGITVSKKVSKHAVVRNRIKRQVREFFRQNQYKMPNHDYVVIAQLPASNAGNNSLNHELAKAWRNLTGTSMAEAGKI